MSPPTEFFQRLPEMSDRQLAEMLTKPEDYLPEALEAARAELRKRSVPVEQIATFDAQGEARRVNIEEEMEKRKWFPKIDSRQAAVKESKVIGCVFWVIAVIKAIGAAVLSDGVWTIVGISDSVMVTILAGIIFFWQIRPAAVLLALLSAAVVVIRAFDAIAVIRSADLGFFSVIVIGWLFFYPTIFFLLSLRAVQVTFKFHEFTIAQNA